MHRLMVISVIVASTLYGEVSFSQTGDESGGPYEVVDSWIQPFAAPGYAFGSHPGVFAESQDRIFVVQRGELKLPDPVPDGFKGYVGSIGMNALRGERAMRNCIFVVDGNGKLVESWTQWDHLFSGTAGIHKIRINRHDPERRVWVINDFRHQINVFSNDGAELLFSLGEADVAAADDSHFGRPQDIAVLADGTLFVADGLVNSRVVKLDADGNFVAAWGSKGSEPGQFDGVHAVETDDRDRVYVADRGNDRIQVFDHNGELLAIWGGLNFPNHIVITADQQVWVADNQPVRMVQFDTEGRRLSEWDLDGNLPGQFQELHQFSVDDAGNFYGADNLLGRTLKFIPRPGASTGKLIGAPVSFPAR